MQGLAIVAAAMVAATAPVAPRADWMPVAEANLYLPYSRHAPAELGLLKLSTGKAAFAKLRGVMDLKYIGTRAPGVGDIFQDAPVEIYEVTNVVRYQKANPKAAEYSSAKWLTLQATSAQLVSISFCKSSPVITADCGVAVTYLAN